MLGNQLENLETNLHQSLQKNIQCINWLITSNFKFRALKDLLVLALVFLALPAQAQVIPDGTLGNENSVLIPNATIQDKLVDLIEGGAIRGENLFHSFEQFSISHGGQVYFANPEGIANILTRITGNNISEIFGTLGVNGNANLFLLNPNGIIFGENAALDVNGSFLATTGESYLFENGFAYSATNPEIPPLLTINIPVGVQMGANPTAIEIRGTGNNLALDLPRLRLVPDRENRPPGLAVKSNSNLVLLGGEVNLLGGNLTAEQGRIELGGVTESDTVGLSSTDNSFSLNYDNIEQFGDINLTQAASVYLEGDGHQGISLNGRNIFLSDGSAIFAGITGQQNGGQLKVSASESLELFGSNEQFLPSMIHSYTDGQGTSGAVKVDSNKVVLRDGGVLVASTLAEGTGENLEINAQSTELRGFGRPPFFIASFIGFRSSGSGNAGNLRIETDSLLLDTGLVSSIPLGDGDGGNVEINTDTVSVFNGGQIQSGAAIGSGNGGDLIIKANAIKVVGVTPFNINPETNLPNNEGIGGKASSGLFSSVNGRSTGNAGNVFIETNSLKVSQGGTISSNTNSIGSITNDTGNAGDIFIQAQDVEIRDTFVAFNGAVSGIRATVQENVFGEGGNISIDAENLRVLDGGQIRATTAGNGNAGDVTLNVSNLEVRGVSKTEDLVSKIAASSETDFASGSIAIVAENINISDRGDISVSNLGNGNAGSLDIVTKDLNLDNSAIIEAKVGTGNQGNIGLTTENIVLKNNSEVNVIATGSARGGNIQINNSKSIVLQNGSQIVADAVAGNGGSIDITTQGLLSDSSSKISASSQFGLDGKVSLEVIDSDRALELTQLPQSPIDATEIITQGCSISEDFAITGKGGLSHNPMQNLKEDVLWQDLRLPKTNFELTHLPEKTPLANVAPPEPVLEATTWQINFLGNLELVADSTSSGMIYQNYQCTQSS